MIFKEVNGTWYYCLWCSIDNNVIIKRSPFFRWLTYARALFIEEHLRTDGIKNAMALHNGIELKNGTFILLTHEEEL